jgi:hypothetical protein
MPDLTIGNWWEDGVLLTSSALGFPGVWLRAKAEWSLDEKK